MKTIAMVNHKGGVAKTTTASNVASLLSRYVKILAIDLDPQCNLTKSFVSEKYDESVFDLMVGRKCNPVIKIKENFDILPGSIELTGIDAILGRKLEKERVLADILEKGGYNDEYDYIIIDCPPTLEILTINALVAATHMIIPVVPEYHSVSGLMDIADTYELIKKRLNPGIEFTGILITMYNSSKNLHTTINKGLRESYGDKMFNTVIRENIKLAECPGFQKDIFEYAPKSNGAADYTAFTEELIQKLEGK